MDEFQVNLWAWVQRVTTRDLPPAPFVLRPGTVVVDCGLWLNKLKEDAQLGPKGPRAKTGALYGDMRRVYELATVSKRGGERD